MVYTATIALASGSLESGLQPVPDGEGGFIQRFCRAPGQGDGLKPGIQTRESMVAVAKMRRLRELHFYC